MFGRGNWAILGLETDSLEAFAASVEDRLKMIAASQLAASAVTRHLNIDTLGLNPFSAPRMDEQHPMPPDQQQHLVQYAATKPEERSGYSLPLEVLEHEGYGFGVEQFRVHQSLPWYGFWAVANQWKDISDLASIKEQYSYSTLERPYKFLQATDKKTVDKDTRGATAAVRKQFPVLLDFNQGRLYIENSNKKAIYLVKEALRALNVEIVPVGWSYNRANWPSELLNRLHEGSHYLADFEKRAEETARFRAKEIEKLEDRELEKIVSNYFSMTELRNELWIGISNPAQVRLHLTSQPIAIRAAATATTLLNMTNDAHIVSGAITVQERITTLSKKGGEITFRKDLIAWT